MTDAFTSASPLYRRAQGLGTRPMPLAAGEVATLKRRYPVNLIRASLQLLTGAAFCGGLLWLI